MFLQEELKLVLDVQLDFLQQIYYLVLLAQLLFQIVKLALLQQLLFAKHVDRDSIYQMQDLVVFHVQFQIVLLVQILVYKYVLHVEVLYSQTRMDLLVSVVVL